MMASQNVLPMTLFKILFHLGHELIRRGPIDDPMVEREAEIPHRSDRNRVVDDDGTFLNRADPENGNLRLMNDRGAEQAAEATMIGDGECSALDLIGAEFLGPRPFGQIRDLFPQ